jgi:uncharacterized protein
VERDRDEQGRARNARARDALGRPLPPGSTGVERIPDDVDLTPRQTLTTAQDLLDRGLAFNAHEVLESAWKKCPPEERELWQGVTQLAVGITHIQRGNAKGARILLSRAHARLSTAPARHGIAAEALAAHCQSLLADLDSTVPASISPDRLRIRLTR